MIWVYFVRVNMTDGALPAGLQSSDIPLNLYDIEFCISNLRGLPEDLDSKWLMGTMVYIEYTQFTSVPLALTRLDPYYLALTGNPIDELPPEIFEIPDMLYLGIGSTNIRELPRNVTNLSPLMSFIYITDTNISYFWPWIDDLVERKLTGVRSLLMGGSTYCAELKKITSGETNTFSVLPSPEYSKYLTDPSEANRNVIVHTVNCEVAYAAPFYPLELDDNANALNR
ncbi:Centrosomal protein of 41 kDa [Phytophthora boehmeriae]|uniref:Centrosomal protein of 41 kDa n=1 Tax=Phytophthora boehmeriae TaxID=109152 RepID=A0A8T1X7X9_9STRA|nr:Centrosomal protein of 41 kDa [Phytophthora boehmeriae]